jgi:putative oxidoreductase
MNGIAMAVYIGQKHAIPFSMKGGIFDRFKCSSLDTKASREDPGRGFRAKNGEGTMTRNLARTLVFLGITCVIVSMGWWAAYYNEVVGALGPKPALTHPMRCLLWTADICVQPQAKVQNIPAYTPLALWASLVVLLLGLFVVYRTASTEPYPVTPPGEPSLVIPKLEPFYAWVRDLSWPLMRIAAGGTLLAVGIDKVLNRDIVAFAAGSLARRGLEPSMAFAYTVYFLESAGALMIILGLFTRFFAAALAIEFFIITFVGAFATAGYLPGRGWGVFLMWGLLFFAIALRGGGPYSLDRLLRREL